MPLTIVQPQHPLIMQPQPRLYLSVQRNFDTQAAPASHAARRVPVPTVATPPHTSPVLVFLEQPI